MSQELAELIEKLWNSPVTDIKSIYETCRRPANTPSLQPVTLDDELKAALPDKSRIKRLDGSLAAVNKNVSKAAVATTKIIELLMTSDSAESRQQAVDQTIDLIQILSYGNSSLHSIRKEQMKPALDPAVRSKLCKTRAVEEINTSHQLFGGDIQKQVKEGEASFFGCLNSLLLQIIYFCLNICYS